MGRYQLAQAWPSWPPPLRTQRELRAVNGFRVPPHVGWFPNFIFHLRIDHHGVFRASGVEITYTQGHTLYRLFDPLQLKVCTYTPCYLETGAAGD